MQKCLNMATIYKTASFDELNRIFRFERFGIHDTITTTVQSLLDYFNRLIPLAEEEKDFIRAKFHPHLHSGRRFIR
jgi:predicted DNA-binding protein YlxM (UPF0122 family)